jgi:hypothetical protein
MPNINEIAFKVENGKVLYDSFGLMLGFPSNLRKECDKEILEKVQNYQGKTDVYPIGTVKVVNNEYYRIEFDYPSKFKN